MRSNALLLPPLLPESIVFVVSCSFASCLIQGFSVHYYMFLFFFPFVPSCVHVFSSIGMQARPRKLPLEGNHVQSAQLPRIPTPKLHCRLNWGFLGAPIAGWVIVEIL